jgi:hypothetical protein
VQDLADAVSWERRIRGVAVKPIIALESAVWQSSRGPIAIPKLAIIDWSDVTGGGSLPSGNTPPPAIDNKPPEPSATQAALRQHLGNAPKSPIPQPRRRQRNQATEKAEPTLSLRDDLDDDIPY